MWNRSLDLSAARSAFLEQGYLVLDHALEGDLPRRVVEAIEAADTCFKLIARNGVHPRTIAFDQPLSPLKQRVLLDQLALAREAGLFTYLYELWEIPEPGERPCAAASLAAFLESQANLDWIAKVSGCPVEVCQVAGITRYRQGHYLGAHSDKLSKFTKQRKVAMILFFSAAWNAGQGGELFVLDENDEVLTRVEPTLNRAVLMNVDRGFKHYVPTVQSVRSVRLALPCFYAVTPERTDE
ncbi:MAG: 2OG-Fe(II) oxygenase [Gammaproteobacteria bacterium]